MCKYLLSNISLCLLIPMSSLSCYGRMSQTQLSNSVSPQKTCIIEAVEKKLDSALTQVISEVDFSFVIERLSDGRRYNYNRGQSSLQSSYESASTSKIITAVIILRLVDQGILNLSDRPQDYISNWPIPASDSLYPMTLAQLLSFTSGLTDEPICLNIENTNFESCVKSIALKNIGNGLIPGKEFYYSSTHLQVAGLMAMKAAGVTTWQSLFLSFKKETSLFSNSSYNIPSLENPRLAGGMNWTGDDVMSFLKSFSTGLLLSQNLQTNMLTNQTAQTSMTYSPVFQALGEDWRYGFGLWHECQSPVFNCKEGVRISSPGAYGAYPYWDSQLGYYGLVARQGALGTFPNGIAIERSVRELSETWSTCK